MTKKEFLDYIEEKLKTFSALLFREECKVDDKEIFVKILNPMIWNGNIQNKYKIKNEKPSKELATQILFQYLVLGAYDLQADAGIVKMSKQEFLKKISEFLKKND